MSLTLDKNLIIRKLGLLEGYISELEPIVAFTEDEMIDDKLKLHTAERLFQLIVDEMIDINTHLIRVLVLPPPSDVQGTFATLGNAKILPSDFTTKISPIIGLRNAIVHRYEGVSLKQFIHELKRDFNDFKIYSILISDKFAK